MSYYGQAGGGGGGGWNGGFGNVQPSTSWNGNPVGNYQPGYDYPSGHPYHHSNHSYNGAPIGAYQTGYNYPSDHPYHHHHSYF